MGYKKTIDMDIKSAQIYEKNFGVGKKNFSEWICNRLKESEGIIPDDVISQEELEALSRKVKEDEELWEKEQEQEKEASIAFCAKVNNVSIDEQIKMGKKSIEEYERKLNSEEGFSFTGQ